MVPEASRLHRPVDALLAVVHDRAELPRVLDRLAELHVPPEDVALMGGGSDALVPPAGMRRLPLAEARAALQDLATRVPYPGLDEVLFAAIGGYFGLLGSLLLVTLSPVGPLLVIGGDMLLAAVGVASSVAGAGLGTLLGAITEEAQVESHRAWFERALGAGDWILLVKGPEELLHQLQHDLGRGRVAHQDWIGL